MKRKANPGRRGLQMRQRVTQKHTMRNVVIASSILGCIAIALVVVNLSSKESSYADTRNVAAATTYRSVETHLAQRMLIDNSNSNRGFSQVYKGIDGTQSLNMVSRAEDIIVKKINEPSAE
jgi:hypothetical protein